ncbi:MAG: DUF2339 domain-containing protein [Alphaproteobacteria bacterium]|nr:DUF2339 domain-containing protein [Alphaproteobacteria bacterium]
MELIFLLIGLSALITFFMPWINHSRFNSVRNDIARLQRKVKDLEVKLANAPELKQQVVLQQKVDVKQEEAKFDAPEEDVEVYVQSEIVPPMFSKTPKADWAQKAQSTFEQNIATKLPVWIGTISLICASFFFVKYSIEHSWLEPIARVSLGGVFGGTLLAVGQWIGRREHIANSVRIGQGLIGAGLVALYISVYAAINLYGLLPPILGFGSMTVITALAVILSLRHGQPIAVFGLLGGLLTPALIGSDEPNAIAMFGYLFLLFSGMFMVLVRKGWWVLTVAALIGVFCWSIFWFLLIFSASDALVLVLFAMAITGVVLAVTGKRVAENAFKNEEKLPVHGLNFIAIAGGVLTIVWLSFEVTLTLFDWSMLGLLSMAVIALAYFQPSIYQKPLLVKLGANLIIFLIWGQVAPLVDAVAVLAGMSVIYIGGCAFIMRQVQDPRFWAGVQVVAALALYVISYFILDLPVSFIEGFGMFWGVISLVLASLSIYQAYDIREKYRADSIIREHLVAIYALATSAFISLGLAIELPWSYVPLAIAGQIAATAWIYQRTQINFLKKIMLILTLVFAAMNYEQIMLFGEVVFKSLWGDVPSTHYIASYVLDVPLVKLGVPSLLISLALWMSIKLDDSDQKFNHILFGTATTLAMATVYYVFRDLLHANHVNIFATSAGFIERGVITIACASAGIGLLQLVNRYDMSFLKPWGYGLFHLGMLRFAYFDFLIDNPYWSKLYVGDMLFFNGITLTYGVGAFLATWAVYNKNLLSKKMIYKVLGFVSLFAFATFTVRQYFHGGYIIQGFISSAELYAYSVAWLVTGLGLLTVGIKKQNKTVRMASLVFVILAVLKVFLFDVAELEGLYRVFSFLGLGVSLIGLSYFYTKLVFSNEQIQKEA